VVSVTLVAPVEEELPEDSVDQRAASEPEPWNDFSSEPPMEPESESLEPERAAIDDLPALERQQQRLPTPTDQTPMPDVSPSPEIPLPVPAMISDTSAPPVRPAAEAMPEIETPPAAVSEAPRPDGPPALEPSRLARIDESLVPDRETPAELPEDLLAGSIAIQRLTDLPATELPAEALPADRDETSRSLNRPGQSADASSSIVAGGGPLMPIPMVSMPSPVDTSPMQPASIRRAADDAPLPAAYRGRKAADRSTIVVRNGGNADTEAAVQAALVWLAANQESDGRWDPQRHNGGREEQVLGHDRGGAGSDSDTGITALALLAFLGTGQSHLDGEYRETIRRGLEFLLRSQSADGNLAGKARLFARMYCHGMAALAISEAYAMTGDTRLRPFVERAIAYTIRSQNLSDGGWRYQPGDAGDMSQFGWQLMAIKSAELAGVSVPSSTHQGMRRFLDSVRAGSYGGLASYRPHGAASATMTAEALFCRLFLGAQDSEAATQEAVERLLQETPQSGEVNLYYWYYATVALFQLQGPNWTVWNDHLQQRLLTLQETTGGGTGSWPPKTVWGSYGGRVYTTALATLCLEVYYRFMPLYVEAAATSRTFR
ncbi:MAG: hypothetical protein JJ992_22950, partial [Planctomycetes bacterium]|nr:hypothetical protein [Planctomycetota bacterium]